MSKIVSDDGAKARVSPSRERGNGGTLAGIMRDIPTPELSMKSGTAPPVIRSQVDGQGEHRSVLFGPSMKVVPREHPFVLHG